MAKKPFSRILQGNGTYAAPFVVRNDLAFNLDRIPTGGYDYELGQIAKVRELFEQTEMDDGERARFAKRIDTKELRSRALRPRYLLRRVVEIKRQNNIVKAERFYQQAKAAYVDLKHFADKHPELLKEHQLNTHWSKILEPIKELE